MFNRIHCSESIAKTVFNVTDGLFSLDFSFITCILLLLLWLVVSLRFLFHIISIVRLYLCVCSNVFWSVIEWTFHCNSLVLDTDRHQREWQYWSVIPIKDDQQSDWIVVAQWNWHHFASSLIGYGIWCVEECVFVCVFTMSESVIVSNVFPMFSEMITTIMIIVYGEKEHEPIRDSIWSFLFFVCLSFFRNISWSLDDRKCTRSK